MARPYRFISFARAGDIFCVSLQRPDIPEDSLEELGAELARLVDEENGRKIVMNLGPEEPECLFSVFLAKLIQLQRRLEGLGGKLVLAHASAAVRSIFAAAGIETFFAFHPDQQSAVQALRSPAGV